MTVCEKVETPNGILLHAHHLFHAPPRLRAKLLVHSSGAGSDCYISSADADGPKYVTKQRAWLGPDFEKHLQRQRIRSRHIDGQRLTLTTAARSLVMSIPTWVRPPIAAFSNSHFATSPSAPAFQFHPDGLFGSLPDQHAPERAARSRPRPRLKFDVRHEGQIDLGFRIENVVRLALHRIGGTHETYAARLGLSRPQATNILNGQFGASRTVVRHAIELMRAAA